MPLTAKGEKILENLRSEYGSDKKAKEVLYAGKNKGTFTGIDAVCDAMAGLASHIEGKGYVRDAADPPPPSKGLVEPFTTAVSLDAVCAAMADVAKRCDAVVEGCNARRDTK